MTKGGFPLETNVLIHGKNSKKLGNIQYGAWDSFLVNPSPRKEPCVKVAGRNGLNIDIQDLQRPLDVEETSRIDVRDDYTLIPVDVPTQEERNNKVTYVTIP